MGTPLLFFLLFWLSGIDMDHDVLDIGKIGFHIVMNPFSHRMAFPQCFVTIHFNFQIHIDLVSIDISFCIRHILSTCIR